MLDYIDNTLDKLKRKRDDQLTLLQKESNGPGNRQPHKNNNDTVAENNKSNYKNNNYYSDGSNCDRKINDVVHNVESADH